jgi:hypothetical protein
VLISVRIVQNDTAMHVLYNGVFSTYIGNSLKTKSIIDKLQVASNRVTREGCNKIQRNTKPGGLGPGPFLGLYVSLSACVSPRETSDKLRRLQRGRDNQSEIITDQKGAPFSIGQ